jgi:hypothetical protein
MKTLKVLAMLCIMLGFATNAVNAQKPQGGSENWNNICTWLPCVNEEVCGDVTHSWWWKDGKMWGQEWTGVFIGQSTGTVYTLRESGDSKHFGHEANIGNVNHEMHTLMIHANGKLVALVHGLGHNTVNANGVNVEDFWKGWELECK